MTLFTRKAIRQKLMQGAVLEKIEREKLPINTVQVRESLRRIREQVTGKTMGECMDLWEQLIRTNDLDGIRGLVLSDDERSQEMRNLSPLTVLLNEKERLRVLRRVADHATGRPGYR